MANTNLFHVIEHGSAVTRSKGVWKQHRLYELNGQLFIGMSATSYVEVLVDGKTVVPNVRWVHIICPDKTYKGEFGRVMLRSGRGRTQYDVHAWSKPRKARSCDDVVNRREK